jgi:probable HAF family extracellular repeat protein
MYDGSHACIWSNGTMTDLGPSFAYGTNDYGQVVGCNESDACIWGNGTMTDLGCLPGGSGSFANGINNSGQVVGMTYTPNGAPAMHACIWNNGTKTDLGPGIAYGTNDCGQVVGYSDVQRGCHAFLYSSGTKTDLGCLPSGSSSIAYAVNNSGQVAGRADTNDNAEHACIWSNGTLTDLNALIDPASGWTLCAAMAINDSGQIAGYGFLAGNTDQTEAFLLTPVPEPATLSLLALAGSALLARRRKVTVERIRTR